MDKLKYLARLEKKLAALRADAYAHTKQGNFNQAVDRADWRKREPVLAEIRKLRDEIARGV